MATIRIIRSTEYINSLRDYRIYIDGVKTATIANGKVIDLSLSPGRHSIEARIDWCSSPTLTFEVDDTAVKTFRVGGFRGAKWMLPAAVLFMSLFYLLAFVLNLDTTWLAAFLLPPFLLLAYWITAGRKKYLALEEEALIALA